MNHFKKLSLLFLVSVFVSALILTSCSKERIEKKEEEEKQLNAYDSPDDYLDSKKQEEQEFEITSDDSGSVTGNQGTNLQMTRHCLQKPNGDSVALPYTIKLVELYTAKDMIYWRVPTVSAGTILETAGEVRVRAVKDSVELTATCPYIVRMPNAAPETYMSAFYGGNPDFSDWTDSPVTPFTVDPIGYKAFAQKLGWINCGIKRGATPSYKLSFDSEVDDLTNVRFFIYIPSTKTVMEVSNKISGDIPAGLSVKIIGIALKGANNFYTYENNNLLVSGNTTLDVVMKSSTEAELTTMLNGL
jgi:hypothetical protein